MSNDRLKFRAWDKKGKCMVDWMTMCQTAFNRDSAFSLMYMVMTNHADQFEVMQWTGLYDSEGVEIYENDKVSRGCEPFAPEYCGVVKFHHGCWMVMYDDEAHYFNLHFYVEQCKVTGNIYDA